MGFSTSTGNVVHTSASSTEAYEGRIADEEAALQEKVDLTQLHPFRGMLRTPRRTLSEILRLRYPLLQAMGIVLIIGGGRDLVSTIGAPTQDLNAVWWVLGALFSGLRMLLVTWIIAAIVVGIARLLKRAPAACTIRDVFRVLCWASVPLLGAVAIGGVYEAVVAAEANPYSSTMRIWVPLLLLIKGACMVWYFTLQVMAVSVALQCKRRWSLLYLTLAFVALVLISAAAYSLS